MRACLVSCLAWPCLDAQVGVRSGEELALHCQTDTTYQWCYWEHDGVKFTTTSQDRTEYSQIFQWVRSETSCGLIIPSAQSSHAGEWRCHIADTDQEEEDGVKDERKMNVLVGREASLEISLSVGVSPVEAGEDVEVSCPLVESGHPPAQLTLYHEKRGQEKLQLSLGSPVTFRPQLEDTGSAFSCVWSQAGPSGETLYQGKLHSDPLEVVVAPTILTQGDTELLFTEDLRIPVKFRSKPWPQENDIVWLLDAGRGEEQQITQIEHYMEKVRGELCFVNRN